MPIYIWIGAVVLIILLMLYFIMKRKTKAVSQNATGDKDAFVEVEVELDDTPQSGSDSVGSELDESIKEAGQDLKDGIKNAADDLGDKVEEKLADVKEDAEKIADSVAETVEEGQEKLAETAENISEAITEKKTEAEKIVEKAREIMKEGKKAQTEAVSDIVKSFTDPEAARFIELAENTKKAKEIRNGFVSIDVETTGIDANINEITGIAAVKYIDGVKVGTFQTNVNTSDSADQSLAPDVKESLNKFFAFLKHEESTLPIVTHFSRFAMNFLKKKSEEKNIAVKAAYFDIHKFSKTINTELKDHKLNTLSSFYSIEGHESNDAVSDATAIGEIFLKMTE